MDLLLELLLVLLLELLLYARYHVHRGRNIDSTTVFLDSLSYYLCGLGRLFSRKVVGRR